MDRPGGQMDRGNHESMTWYGVASGKVSPERGRNSLGSGLPQKRLGLEMADRCFLLAPGIPKREKKMR
jgi:hypothetical protein